MRLDIVQMNYLIAIVDADYNLSDAAKQIHVTQSTLSQFISNFEKAEAVALFNRKNGRLVSLTPVGKRLYEDVVRIMDIYTKMESVVESEAQRRKGVIRIGIPTTALRILFTRFFPRFLSQHPDIRIEIVEEGTKRLKQMLLDNDLHFALLEDPTELDPVAFEQHILMLSEVAAFMRPQFPLAQKRLLSWRDLDDQWITLLDDGFIYNERIHQHLEQIHSTSKILMTSTSWDYLVESAVANDIVALLPTARFNRYIERLKNMGVVEKRFADPINFATLLCRPVKTKYHPVENYVYETILNGFYRITGDE